MRNILCALTVTALGCFCGKAALASSATFAISPNPAATGQAIAVTAKISPGVTATNARLTLWLYNSSNNAYAGQVSLTGLSYTVNQTTTSTIALPSTLAAGGYYFNPSLYTSGGGKLWGTTHAGTFTVGSTGAGAGAEAPSASHTIKWNPGHYMASNSILSPGEQFVAQPAGTWNRFLSEVNQLNNQDNVVGYTALVYWSALEPSQDKYDFSQISALLNYLKTHFNKQKRLVLVVMPGKNSTTDARGAIPKYISSSSMYGPSPIAGSYGWWGGKGNGITAVAALHRPAVMERWIKLHEKLGAAFNRDPNFEGIMFAETSWVIGASKNNGAPDWNAATSLANWENLVDATAEAFPNTTVIVENTWLDTPLRTQQLERFMFERRVVAGTMDTYGQSWMDQHGGNLNNGGMNEYIGKSAYAGSPALGPDMRSRMHSMVFIEPPNLGIYTSGAGYTPADICSALNKSYASSHAFWTNVGNGNTSRPSANWSNVLATINKCPLVHTGYPEIYP